MPLTRKKPIGRNTSLARSGALPPTSRKRRKQKREQQKAYAAAPDAEQCWCSVCGKPGPVEHSHHYSQKQHKAQANNSRNWLVMGKYCGCHTLFEHHKAAFAAQHPDAWQLIIEQMAEVDPQAFEFFKLKNAGLFAPATLPTLEKTPKIL